MKFMFASQFYSSADSLLANCALSRQPIHLLQLLILLISNWRPLAVPSSVSYDSNYRKGGYEWERKDHSLRLKKLKHLLEYDFLRLRSFFLWLGSLLGNSEWNIVSWTALILHLLDGLWEAVLALEALLGDCDFRAIEAPEKHIFLTVF
jgi:hypothetical protein